MDRPLASQESLNLPLRVALYLAFALLLLYPFVSSSNLSDVFVDEVGFMSAGHAGVTQLLQGDLNGPRWNANDWACYGWNHPALAKLLIGASIYATGHGGHEYPTWVNKLPSPTDTEVRAARWPGVLFGWGSCLLLLVVGCRISVFTGVAASSFAAYNGSYIWSCALAMLEGPLMFFMVLTLLAVLGLKDRLYGVAATPGVVVWASIAVGISAAAALSSKLNGGAVCLFAAALPACLAVSPFFRAAPVPRPRLAVLSTLTVVLVMSLGFYCINPQFHRQPIAQLRTTLLYWRDAFPRMSRWESFTTVTRQVMSVMPTSKELYRPVRDLAGERWPGRMNQFDAVYGNSPASIEALLIGLTVLSIARARWKRGRLAPVSDEELLLAFAVIVWTATIAWMPMVQGRYFLPPYVTTPLLVAIGLGIVGSTLARCAAMIASPVAARIAGRRLAPGSQPAAAASANPRDPETLI